MKNDHKHNKPSHLTNTNDNNNNNNKHNNKGKNKLWLKYCQTQVKLNKLSRWVAGAIKNKTISASNNVEAELGNKTFLK